MQASPIPTKTISGLDEATAMAPTVPVLKKPSEIFVQLMPPSSVFQTPPPVVPGRKPSCGPGHRQQPRLDRLGMDRWSAISVAPDTIRPRSLRPQKYNRRKKLTTLGWLDFFIIDSCLLYLPTAQNHRTG